MKLVMDEKLKHRLIGLAVIISLGAIFAPAAMRKSGQRMDTNFSVNVKLPNKPQMPEVSVTDEKELFKTIKVARIKIPAETAQKEVAARVEKKSVNTDALVASTVAELAKADLRINDKTLDVADAARSQAKTAVQVTRQVATKQPKPVLAQAQAQAQAKKPVTLAKVRIPAAARVTAKAKPAMRQEVYAVQLASFSRANNAQSLVSRLRAKGYKAQVVRVSTRQGPVYKVFAGHSPRKQDVVKLKTQLASAMQLKGFVVSTGVS